MSTKTLSTVIQMLGYSSEFSYPLVKDWEIRATYTCVVLQGAGDTVFPLTSGLGNQARTWGRVPSASWSSILDFFRLYQLSSLLLATHLFCPEE